MSVPRLGPLLMPDTTASGRKPIAPSMANRTQSVGVPEQVNTPAVTSRTFWASPSVSAWETPERSLSGAKTRTSCFPDKAFARTMRPSAPTPSSFVINILMRLADDV